MNTAFQFNMLSDGIGKLTFDLPNEKVNILSQPTLEQLEQVLEDLSHNQAIKSLLICSNKRDVFIAGADLKSFEGAFSDPVLAEKLISLGHKVFNKLSKLSFPTIAVIHGVCLGGGLELALACTYRIVSDHPKTLLGLPEVSLGIFPGWGGTQRLPRLVGLRQGTEMILTSKPVPAFKAWKMHLADAIFAWEFLDEKILEFAKEIQKPEFRKKIREKNSQRGIQSWLLEENSLGRYLLFQKFQQETLKKTKGHYPSPLIALKLIEESCTLPLDQGLEKEIDTIVKNMPKMAPVARNLIGLFFTQEALKKNAGMKETANPYPIKAAAVLGAGTMGGGIAWLLSSNNFTVRIKDINWEVIGRGYNTAHLLYSKLVKIKKLKKTEANLKFHRLSATLDYRGFQNIDFLIEAVPENLELKRQIFTELETKIRPNAIIASNTSSLTIADMSKDMQHPERFVGMHFFNPPDKMPLVEVVSSEKTSKEVVATVVDVCRKLNKTPIIVGDCPGFLVNRIFVLGANEVLWMLQEGVEMERLEKMMLDFGMPMAPFVLFDEVGNDVTYKVSLSFEKAYGERMKCPSILQKIYEQKLYGKKVSKGFYLYEGTEKKNNPEVKQLLGSIPPNTQISEDEMRDRVMFIMINEASRCLEENIISNPAYLDMALIMGIGFPPFRGGLLRYADSRGSESIVQSLVALEKTHGLRFTPSKYLLEMGQNKKSFY